MSISGGAFLLKKRFILAASLLFCLTVLSPSLVTAVNPVSVKDTLSDSRKSSGSSHRIVIVMSAGTSFASGETYQITLGSGFAVPSFAASDVTINDGTARTVMSSCSAGSDNVGLGVSGQVITLTACSGFTASATGATVTIVLGTGSTLITNPSTSGIKPVTLAGSYGDDAKVITVAIIESVTVTVTITGPTGNVRFTGDAFPGALVTILDGGAVVGNTTANATSFFDKTVTGLDPGDHSFSIFAQALDGRKTLTLGFSINVISGSTVTVSGIILPPIISVPSTQKRPAVLIESGLAKHNSTITTFTNSHNQIDRQVSSNSNGEWSVGINSILHLGSHTASALVNDGLGGQSILSAVQSFQITLSADLNVDNLINLTDFSILMFSYAQSPVPNLAADINDNGQSDLVDFSVMMYHWTG